jgi:hypothetical protein
MKQEIPTPSCGRYRGGSAGDCGGSRLLDIHCVQNQRRPRRPVSQPTTMPPATPPVGGGGPGEAQPGQLMQQPKVPTF